MKAWYRSKTMWFNIISALLVALEGYVGMLAVHFGPDAMQVVVGVIVVGNMALRAATTTAVSVK